MELSAEVVVAVEATTITAVIIIAVIAKPHMNVRVVRIVRVFAFRTTAPSVSWRNIPGAAECPTVGGCGGGQRHAGANARNGEDRCKQQVL